ncbi:MAG: nucleoside 2-deoxyribosyltransferase [Nanoarchaeota archaeon]|nr:nucleoside 2-deoxyribosyltransferase [Nanoarchaeota archaeon]
MRCFLSYSYKTDISVIKAVLTELNISYVNPAESLEYGHTVLDTSRRQIKDSDFIIAVMDMSPNVAFEIGMSYGSKKPIFLIVPEKQEHGLSGDLSGLTHTLSDPTDYNKIKYNLKIFVNQLPRKRQSSREIKRRRKFSGPKLTPKYIASLGDVSSVRGVAFEGLIEDIFSKLGIDILAQNRNKANDFRADFSIWISELDSIIGNPIIVETKSTSNSSSLKNAVSQLTYCLRKYNSKTGFLIYNAPNCGPNLELFGFAPLVISISIQNLLQKLTEKSLAEIILELRNNAVHKEIH